MEEQKTTVCPNCGATFEVTQAACPYCGAIYEPGAEQAYMEKLADVKEELEDLSEVGEQQLKQEVGRHTKRIGIIVAVVLAVFLVLFGIWQLFWMLVLGGDNTADAKAQLLWERENFSKLDELYEQGDYEAIDEFLDEAYEDGYTAWNWEHNGLISIYSGYSLCMEERDMLTDPQEANLWTAQYILGEIMYVCYRISEEDYPAEDWQIIEGWQQELESILYGELQFSEEEAEELRSAAITDGSIDYDVIDDYAKKIWKRCITE